MMTSFPTHPDPHTPPPDPPTPVPLTLQDLCKRLGDSGVSTVFDLLDLDDDKRRELLGLPENQLADVAAVCARYPDIQVRACVRSTIKRQMFFHNGEAVL